MTQLRAQIKIFIVTFSLAFVALFIIHLVYLPFYWANASSQQGRPSDLYLPNMWTPAIAFYSLLIAVIAIVTFSLLSWLSKRKPKEANAEGIIFITTFLLGWAVFWVLFALGPLQFGHTLHIYNYWTSDSPTNVSNTFATFLFSSISAVLLVVVFEFYKQVRSARKPKSKAAT